jgi:fused signal recognition particle receptor
VKLFVDRIQAGLKRTREGVFGKVSRVIAAKKKLDDALLEELEEILIGGDVGVETTLHLIESIKTRVKSDKYHDSQELERIIRDEIALMLLPTPASKEVSNTKVMLVIGVNGTGKTTSIAKLAHRFHQEGKSVLLVAADTFRAAAIDQLAIWAERTGCSIVKHQSGSDPSAVVFDAVTAAQARKMDYLIIDTAGRLHTKTNLMAELSKIVRVIQNKIPDAPHEVLLVLDASTGQNAVNQAREFKKIIPIDGIFLAKIDGTAKGGVVLAINRELNIPVKYIGMGETLDDIADFDRKTFVDGLFFKE